MDERTYKAGSSALEIIHKYNTADISFSDAKERIQLLYDKLKKLELEGDERTNNLVIVVKLMTFIAGEDPYGIEDSLREILK